MNATAVAAPPAVQLANTIDQAADAVMQVAHRWCRVDNPATDWEYLHQLMRAELELFAGELAAIGGAP